jgi:hypothetical protein
MKNSGLVNKILGIHMTWKEGSICLDQEAYVRSILEEFKMLNSKPQKLPISPSINLDDPKSLGLTCELYSKY